MIVHQKNISTPKYRPDIDGLRAISILAVVAFHAFPNWVRGGFIGVDVFFVISGYLISTGILENLEKGTFSFSQFYARRIKRIFPALIVILLVCFIIGWFVLLADEYKQLNKHIASIAGFVPNIVYWYEAGYFDNSSDTKPLLHLWSLGIEEQFYIVWPLLLWFAWKKKINIISLTLVLIFISFAINLNDIKQYPISTFYSPQTRFWQLLSGGLLALLNTYNVDMLKIIKIKINHTIYHIFNIEKQEVQATIIANVLSFLGLLILAYGFLQFNIELKYPGKWALIPVVGTLMLIFSGPEAWINRKILSNKIAIWLGLISFPLYLWHWPLLSFLRILESGTPSRNLRILAVALSIFFAWLTYKLIECPIRYGKNGKYTVIVLILVMILIFYVGYYTYSRDGLNDRIINKNLISYSESIKLPIKAKECFDIPYAFKKNEGWFCNLGRSDLKVNYFVYGDSHAMSLIPALEQFAINNKLRIQFAGASGCPSLLDIQSVRGETDIEKYNCKELNERIFNYVKNSRIDTVILANRWTYYTDSFSRPGDFNPITRNLDSYIDKTSSTKDLVWAIQNTVSRYSSINVKVIFIEDNPQQINDPKNVLRKGRGIETEYLKYSVTLEEHKKNQNAISQVLKNTTAKIINLDDILCFESICPLVANSKFLYFDDNHLSVYGSLFTSEKLSIRILK